MQKANGATLGSRHIERSSATRMMQSISFKMHDSLVNYLIKANMPFSIIVDTSTDQGNRNFFTIFIKSMENNWPQSYFYRSVTTKTENPEHLHKLLISILKEDKLYEHFVTNLYGFASDGAPVLGRLK
jgi:hypothetical protein